MSPANQDHKTGQLPVPVSYESLTGDQLRTISRSFTAIQTAVLGVGNIDLSKGAGVISSNTKCVWRTDGCRITMSFSGSALTASASKEADPLADPRNR